MNELVSLAILALMAIALIAGQAGATQSGTEGAAAAPGPQAPGLALDAMAGGSAIRADVAIAIDFEGIVALVDGGGDLQRAPVEIRTAGRR
jgi:hypothetical protein